MLQRKDVAIDDGLLRLKNNEYSLTRIIAIEARSLTLRDHWQRIVGCGLLFCLLGWVILPELGAVLLIVGALIAVITAGKYELRAKLHGGASLESQRICLARSREVEDFALFQHIAEIVGARIRSY